MTRSQLYLPDVNVLVALCLTSHQHHRRAHEFLGRVGRWATCPTTESALLRLLLNPAVTGPTSDPADRSAQARSVVAGLGKDPRWIFLADDTSFAWSQVDTSVLMGHRQVTDLHLVNLAARHDAQLATFDARIATWVAPSDRHRIHVVPA